MRTRIMRLIADENLVILADATLLSELEDVCVRPKFARFITSSQVEAFLEILHNRLTFIKSHSKVQICRDPDDDYLLAICLDGDADYLLTGDSDLLTLQVFEKTRILTLSEFELLYG